MLLHCFLRVENLKTVPPVTTPRRWFPFVHLLSRAKYWLQIRDGRHSNHSFNNHDVKQLWTKIFNTPYRVFCWHCHISRMGRTQSFHSEKWSDHVQASFSPQSECPTFMFGSHLKLEAGIGMHYSDLTLESPGK